MKNQNVYGYYGLGHTLKAPIQSGYSAMASRLIQQDEWFHEHLVAANFIFTDSYISITSTAIPTYFRDEGPKTRMPFPHDDIWMSYLFGIEDLKRLTRTGSTTILKLNGEDSPYKNSKRLFTMMQILPMGQLVQASGSLSSADYTDYLILVRDSDWAVPLMSGNNDFSPATLDG